jgi:enoyl-CoA hydratase/3-hydroxyacyl-CoA dehydrogenase
MLVSTTRRADGVVVLTLRNPPVNALSSALQRALSEALRATLADAATRAVVLASDNPAFFSGGADVSEFASISRTHNPFGPETSACYGLASEAEVPVVAAVPGACLGGGLELALCCAARVAGGKATFGLPELRLGIIPGLGGTQRLPRLVGFEAGVRMMLTSRSIGSGEAKAMGLVDEVLDGSGEGLVDAAARVALEIASGKREYVRAIEAGRKIGSLKECRRVAAALIGGEVKKLGKGGILPQYEAVVRVALKGVEEGGRAGLLAEEAEFARLVTSATSKAIVHMFFASRATGKVDLGEEGHGYAGRAAESVGVIGGGLMGAGIATSLLAAGCRVVIKEVSEKFIAGARDRVKQNLGEKGAALMGRLVVTAEYAPLADVDMVIEAALEDPRLKREIFGTLEKVCRSDCILATNTSTINIDLIGTGCPKAHAEGRVIGAHFFSPAHKMPLLEIVRTPATSPRVILDVLALGKKMRKTPVVVGNCPGFAVNRMYFPQGMVANFLVAELGVDPFRIDAACEKFGLPMGPFRLIDLVGMDVGVAVGAGFGIAFAERAYTSQILEKMAAAGRKGQRSGAGFYEYKPGARVGVPDIYGVAPFVEEALQYAASKRGPGVKPPPAIELSDQEIVEMILLACVNEGCRILEDEVAFRASDLDVCSCYGMAFPAHRGGLMKWAEAEVGGPVAVRERLNRFLRLSNGACALFKPSFCLERLAAAGMSTFERAPLPLRAVGSASDVVVVSALRTAVGRAGRGGFKDTVADEMLRPILEETFRRTGVDPADIDDVVIGTVLARGDTSLVQTRVASILSGMPVTVPVKTVNRLCSSGLQAIADAAAAIQAGHYKIAIAGGLESMSSAPMQNKEMKPNPVVKRNKDAMHCYLSMGMTSENVAAKFNVSREAQDRMAVTSHARAAATKLAGRQAGEIVPIETRVTVIDRETKKETGEKTVTVDQDEGVRLGVSMAHLAKLQPVFKKGGSTTAGNSSQLSDGAAVVMVMQRSEAAARGLTPLATLRSFAVAGVDPAVMGIGPVEAIPLALKRAGLTIKDIDLFEINEAFGTQSDYVIEKLRLNRDIVNVMGGAIAIGHPLGMSGARMSVSIIHELHRRGGRYGVVSMCIGTGMGAAAVYEIQSSDAPASALPSAKL